MSKRTAVLLLALIFTAIVAMILFIYPRQGIDLTKILPGNNAIPFGFYKVTEVHDGDTFTVNMNGSAERVRLIGVDTPETHHPNVPPQCYGQESTNFTTQKLQEANNAIRLEADPAGDNRDRYGRLLRYAYLPDGSLLQQQIIEGGYGFAYQLFPFSKSEDFATYQTSAQTAALRIWAACQPTLKGQKWQTESIATP